MADGTKPAVRERSVILRPHEVRGIIDGRQTQLRRVMKPQPYSNGFHFDGREILCHTDYLPQSAMLLDVRRGKLRYTTSSMEGWEAECPFGRVGGRLWCREAYMPLPMDVPPDDAGPSRWTIAYAAGGQAEAEAPADYNPMLYNYERWTSSVCMPRWASRITLLIEDARVQRLGDVSDDDARAEGIQPHRDGHGFHLDDGRFYFASARDSFIALWESIYGAWNPSLWVWALTFRRVEVR